MDVTGMDDPGMDIWERMVCGNGWCGRNGCYGNGLSRNGQYGNGWCAGMDGLRGIDIMETDGPGEKGGLG